MKKLLVATLIYIAFGLGSLPEQPLTGGMLVISIFDEKPQIDRRITRDGVYLFDVEM
jgi:hypothetical protein